MDPTTAYLQMFDAMKDKDYELARARALGLKEWFGRGGFFPPRYSKVEVEAYLVNVLRRTAFLNNPSNPGGKSA